MTDEEVFRVTTLCKKRMLGDVFVALEGKTLGAPTAVRVVNAQVNARGKMKARTNGNLVSMFIDHLHRDKVAQITPKEVSAWLVTQGKSKLSASYVLRGALNQGLLKANGKGNNRTYTVREAK